MSKLNILHITPWFPVSESEMEGIFIAEHIKALSNFCHNHVLHIAFSKSFETELNKLYMGISIDRISLKTPISKWKLKEILISRKIRSYLKKNYRKYDIINFYIAYPNAIWINKFIVDFPSVDFTITEQWSAYHNNFELKKGMSGRTRIEDIFKNNVPLFTVSSALGEDIRNFIDDNSRQYTVVPNTIEVENFTFKEKTNRSFFRFSSINSWSKMKNPFVLIRAFYQLHKNYPNLQLVLAGNGHLLTEMKALVKALDLEKFVKMPGRIPKKDVVELLHNTHIYCQSSHYETFSVICIEALSTGTPVLANNVGGMRDFIDNRNGKLVADLEINSWYNAMEDAYLNYSKFDRNNVSILCQNKFSVNNIGELFYNKLKEVVVKNG